MSGGVGISGGGAGGGGTEGTVSGDPTTAAQGNLFNKYISNNSTSRLFAPQPNNGLNLLQNH